MRRLRRGWGRVSVSLYLPARCPPSFMPASVRPSPDRRTFPKDTAHTARILSVCVCVCVRVCARGVCVCVCVCVCSSAPKYFCDKKEYAPQFTSYKPPWYKMCSLQRGQESLELFAAQFEAIRQQTNRNTSTKGWISNEIYTNKLYEVPSEAVINPCNHLLSYSVFSLASVWITHPPLSWLLFIFCQLSSMMWLSIRD